MIGRVPHATLAKQCNFTFYFTYICFTNLRPCEMDFSSCFFFSCSLQQVPTDKAFTECYTQRANDVVTSVHTPYYFFFFFTRSLKNASFETEYQRANGWTVSHYKRRRNFTRKLNSDYIKLILMIWIDGCTFFLFHFFFCRTSLWDFYFAVVASNELE